MQHSRFQKSQEFYGAGVGPQSQYRAVVSRQGNIANIEVDQEAMFRSTGLPYGNIGMVTSYGQSDVFW